MTVRELIQARIYEKRLSMAAVSRAIGKSHSYLQQFIERGIPKKLPEDVRPLLAKELGVTVAALMEGNINPSPKNGQPLPKTGISAPLKHDTSVNPGELLEVLGMAEGGPDGWNLWNGDVVQTINRPDNLMGVKGAYGVLFRGISMTPRYDPNMIGHVHPWKEPVPGDYVVVQRKPAHEGDPPLAVVKRLVRRTAKLVVLAQLNPPREIEVPAGEVVSIHKIVGSSDA